MTDDDQRLRERANAAVIVEEQHPGMVLCRGLNGRYCPVLIPKHSGRVQCRGCARG